MAKKAKAGAQRAPKRVASGLGKRGRSVMKGALKGARAQRSGRKAKG